MNAILTLYKRICDFNVIQEPKTGKKCLKKTIKNNKLQFCNGVKKNDPLIQRFLTDDVVFLVKFLKSNI